MMEIETILKAFKTKGEMAKAFGVSRPAISRWVKRQRIPALRVYQWREIERTLQQQEQPQG